MESLSKRQTEVFGALREFIRKHGYPPTMRDLARKLGIVNPTAIKRMLDLFEEKGLLESAPGKSRAIRLTDSSFIFPFPEEIIALPVAGRIVAGTPEEAIETIEEKVPIPLFLANHNPKAFLLRVKGDSMEPELHEGDLVVIHPQATANSRELVAAMVNEEATVKQLLKKEGRTLLHALNPHYSDIRVNQEFKLIGKVTGLIRKF